MSLLRNNMQLRKYLHSCIVLEKEGRRLLIDPGTFVFVEGKMSPSDIGVVDAVIITHKHTDHFDPSALKIINAPIFTIREIGDLLEKEGLTYAEITPNDIRDIVGFSVRVIDAPHGPLLGPLPHNIAVLVDDRVLHPGDSHEPYGLERCDVLALPIMAPWANVVEAINFAIKLRAKIVVPIHDAFVKDFLLSRIYQMAAAALAPHGIVFRSLGLGEAIDV